MIFFLFYLFAFLVSRLKISSFSPCQKHQLVLIIFYSGRENKTNFVFLPTLPAFNWAYQLRLCSWSSGRRDSSGTYRQSYHIVRLPFTAAIIHTRLYHIRTSFGSEITVCTPPPASSPLVHFQVCWLFNQTWRTLVFFYSLFSLRKREAIMCDVSFSSSTM